MGNICCDEQGSLSRPKSSKEVDLPKPNPDHFKDKFSKFEVGLPFCRSNITNYAQHIDEAEELSGGNGYVT